LKTVFHREPKEEIERRKLLSMEPLKRKGKKFEKRSYFGECLDIPTRPPWDYSQTKEELEKNEEEAFEKYLDNIYSKYPGERLNYFEHNLNVWRQLWRVCETSDVLCILADCRHPLFHFPPSLYRYIVHVMKKPMILVLTKADLVPATQVEAWLKYFCDKFPSLKVASVNSFNRFKVDLATGKRRKQKVKILQRYNGRWDNLIRIINDLVEPLGAQPLDIPNPSEAPADAKHSDDDDDDDDDDTPSTKDRHEEDEDDEDGHLPQHSDDDADLDPADHKDFLNSEEDEYQPPTARKKPYVTLGFVGSPNVGKSTLINALKGKKMCSESRTPGHTKHRQTLYLNPTLVLADCPGLVYPAIDIPKQLQVLCGIFPIAQIREPYSSIQYIAEHIPLEKVYALKKEEDEDWSAYGICDAYAQKRGYLTKAGRTNPYRAALEMLHDVIDGKVEWYFDPDNSKINLTLYDGGPAQDMKEGHEEDKDDEDDSPSTEEEVQQGHAVERSGPAQSKQSKQPKQAAVSSSDDELDTDSDSGEPIQRTANPFAALLQ